VAAWQVSQRPETVCQHLEVRPTDRGGVRAAVAARRVWTVGEDGAVVDAWLVIRRAADGTGRSALSNAPADTPLSALAWVTCQRDAIECANRDAKTEAGWDELQAQTCSAWAHQLALTILATWCVAQTNLEWAQPQARAPDVTTQVGLDELPPRSMAKVRTMLRAALPLPQLPPDQAAALVVEHVVNRTRSRTSRVKAARHSGPSPSADTVEVDSQSNLEEAEPA
jgi:hypothetical protein